MSGTATIISPADGSATGGQPLSSGSRSTPFSLQLPTGAACPGDSADGGYRVQTFMVPAGVDAATLEFGSTGPTPVATGSAFRQPLYLVTSEPAVNSQTAAATKPGGAGPIINLGPFDLDVYAPGDVPAGAYDVGVACTKGQATADGQVVDSWSARLDVSGDAGALAWTVSGTTASTTGTSAGDVGSGAATGGTPGDAPGAAASGTTAVGAASAPTAGDATPTFGRPPSFGLRSPGVTAVLDGPTTSPLAFVFWLALLVAVVRVAVLLRRSGLLDRLRSTRAPSLIATEHP